MIDKDRTTTDVVAMRRDLEAHAVSRIYGLSAAEVAGLRPQRMKVESIVSEWPMAVQFLPFLLPLSRIGPAVLFFTVDQWTWALDRGTGSILSQTTELSRVKARVKALADKTVSNGCTEAEAMAAAEMVGRLLERYALSMEEIDVREEPCVQVEVPIGGKQRRPIDGCVTAIARFCDCKVWVSRDAVMPSYVFFGFEADVTLASYLFKVIDRAIWTEVATFRAAHPRLTGVSRRSASKSFQQGMAARVADRLTAMHRERDASVAAQRSTGTALVVVKHQVVEDAFRHAEVRLVSAGRLRLARRNGAFRHGMAAGDRVNLSRPIGDTGRTLLS